jgi:hypothetical protein
LPQALPVRHTWDVAAARSSSPDASTTDAARVSRSAAGCLILAAAANLTAVVLFNLRDGVNDGPPPTHAYLVLERGLFMAGMLVSALGFSLLAERDRDSLLLRLGTLGYLAAGVVGVVAETMELAGLEVYPTTVAYVVTAFLGQAVIGLALARSGLVAPWLGRLTLVWNLGWLAGLTIFSPDDVYYPVLHLLMTVPIGIALLRSPAASGTGSPVGTPQPGSG